ncbi:MAG: DUF2877 domain-containing protein [Thermomicrobium sp.]
MLPQIDLVASPVWPLVNGTPRAFMLAATYPRAAYLTDTTHWVSLVVPGASLPPDGIRIGTPVDLRALFSQVNAIHIGNGALVLPDARRLSLSPRCRRWNPKLRLRRSCRQALRPVACSLVEDLRSIPPQEDPSVGLVLHSALAIFDELTRALAHGHQNEVIAHTRRLAGLGPGLTPLGDDLLLGCCLALTILAQEPAPHHDWLALRELLAQTAAPATTARSAAWLRQAGEGEFAREPAVLAYALCKRNARWISRLLERLLAIGSSSGWATAYGVSRALCLLLGHGGGPAPLGCRTG